MTRKPDFFVVGAPKCGTTALDHFLSLHPDIFMARKEMHHFGADLQFGRQFYRRDRNAYLEEFAGASGRKLAGEASVWYLFSESAASEIKQFNPEARIIIMLREPAQMIYSLYNQFRYDGNEHLPTFEEALNAEPQRRKGEMLSRETNIVQGLFYRQTARYTGQIRRYYDLFGADRVHIILHEDLTNFPEATTLSAMKFLGLDSSRAPRMMGRVNEAKQIKRAWVRRLQNDPALRSMIIGMRPLIPKAFLGLMQKADEAVRRKNVLAQRPPPISGETRKMLRAEFSKEAETLGLLLRRDLSHWVNDDKKAAPAMTRDEVTLAA